jgi:hypothetical protein
MKTTHRTLIVLPLFTLLACGGGPEPITTCDSRGGVTPLCGWQNPEDLVALPGGRFIVGSEYGGMEGEAPGRLALLDLTTDARSVLWDGREQAAAAPTPASWGDERCPGAPDGSFSPHGIDLVQRADGTLALLAVQHGGRESVELFSLDTEGDVPTLTWRGCAIAPPGAMLNDVAGRADGSFFVTHMMDKNGFGGPMVGYMRASLTGANSGHAWRWTPEDGFDIQPGTEGPVPNGIALSADERTLFVAYSGQGELRRVDVGAGEATGRATLEPLDNVTVAPDGRLIVAEARASAAEGMSCMELEAGQCAIAFAIVAVDPATLAHEALYIGGPGTPSGAGTVGRLLDDGTLLIGTFAGDRILRVPPEAQLSADAR